MTVMSRAALFEAAWRRPLTEVAADLGVTSTGLKKICDRHDIPTAGRGYWAQVRAGRTFRTPVLRAARDPRLEDVHIVGGRPLPPPVRAAMAQVRADHPNSPRPRRKAPAPPTPDEPRPAAPAAEIPADPGAPSPVRRELKATRRALDRARPDGDGFLRVAGEGVVGLQVGAESRDAAMRFVTALVEAAEQQGWALQTRGTGVELLVAGEAIAFHLTEQPHKTLHEPPGKELLLKAERDRWGGDSRPWRAWDPSPSGRLALVIEANAWSGMRRTYSQRKRGSLEESLGTILAAFAGHAAAQAAIRAKAAAEAQAQARRQRLEAFGRRETQRAAFAEAIAARLAERARLQAVLEHVEGCDPAERGRLDGLQAWLRRRLAALDARLDPIALDISARAAEVCFREPPPDGAAARWSAPEPTLSLWRIDAAQDQAHRIAELEWAVDQGLIVDPAAAEGAGAPETKPGSQTPH